MKDLVYSGPSYCNDELKKVLGSHYRVVTVDPTPESLFPALNKCSVFLDASMKVSISRDQIDKSPSLELIATATTGATHIDSNALDERGIIGAAMGLALAGDRCVAEIQFCDYAWIQIAHQNFERARQL